MLRWTSVVVLVLAGCEGNGAVKLDDLIDQDGDGFFVNDPNLDRADCDDNPGRGLTAFPGGREVCDGLDNDCNGAIDDDAEGALEWYPDDDSDGFGKRVDKPVLSCTVPAGYSANRRDCNDTDANIYPNAPERCNELDDDCDLDVDETFDKEAEWHVDADHDGFGSVDVVSTGCATDPNWVRDDNDCNDVNRKINPDADEICDGVDNNCNGLADDRDLTAVLVGARRWFHDLDADTYGNVLDSKLACLQPTPAAEWVANADDCNDADPAQNPTTIWHVDADRDRHGAPVGVWPRPQCWQPIGHAMSTDDCDDTNPDEWTGRPWYADDDRDGFGSESVVWTGCRHNVLWSGTSGDCADRDPSRNPSKLEVCNGVDDNCDGLVDDADPLVSGRSVWYRDTDGDGFGVFYARTEACAKPAGYAPVPGDCNDQDAILNADTKWYVDRDRDGYGDPFDPAPISSCDVVTGRVPNTDDCDDSDFNLHDFTLWFVDLDEDGVGVGLQPTAQGCITDPRRLAFRSGDCNDANRNDRAGGCFGPREGIIRMTLHADAEPYQVSLRLVCEGLANPITRALLPGDANKDIVIVTPVILAGGNCTVSLLGDVLDLSQDGYPSVDVVACHDQIGSLTLQPPTSTLPVFSMPNCAGCNDPAAVNYDPTVLVVHNAESCIYPP